MPAASETASCTLFAVCAKLAGLTALDARARDIFRSVVETYLETGEPVGSRTVSRGGVHLSPASIRNTMQELTLAGLLAAPHTAGRIPTHAGLRLFVDGLLEIGDVGRGEGGNRRRLAGRGRGFEEALNEASALLAGWRAARASWPARSGTRGSSTWSSWRSAQTRHWRCWSPTTARSRTG